MVPIASRLYWGFLVFICGSSCDGDSAEARSCFATRLWTGQFCPKEFGFRLQVIPALRVIDIRSFPISFLTWFVGRLDLNTMA